MRVCWKITLPREVILIKKAKQSQSGDPSTSELNSAREKLTAASHKLAEALYKAQGAGAGVPPTDGQAASAGTADQQPKDEGVIDAEYVDAEK